MVSDLVDVYGPSLVLVALHSGIDQDWTNTRIAYYPFFAGYPTYLIDGTFDSWHGANPWENWDDDTDLYLADPTDVTIDLVAVQGASADQRDITATVCIEPGGVGKSMRMYLLEILDGYPSDDPNFTRNGVRQSAATQDITLAAGACTDVGWTLTLDATSLANLQNVSFVSWAQDDLASGPADVFQATQLNWPNTSDTIFVDGFETGNSTGWDDTVP